MKVTADLLDITLGQLEVEKSEVKVAKKARVKKKKEPKEVSPKPYLQNDNDHDSDEIVEITPEIFGEETGTIPPHFLMQVNSYKDLGPSFCSSSYYRLNTWRTRTPASPSLSRSRS